MARRQRSGAHRFGCIARRDVGLRFGSAEVERGVVAERGEILGAARWPGRNCFLRVGPARAAGFELVQLRSDVRHRLLHWRDRFLRVLFDFREPLHHRADRLGDAMAGALFAVDHTLAKFARHRVLTLVEALGHARDLLAHVFDRLRAAMFNRADALFEALGEAAYLEAHAVERGGFPALDLVEALLQR